MTLLEFISAYGLYGLYGSVIFTLIVWLWIRISDPEEELKEFAGVLVGVFFFWWLALPIVFIAAFVLLVDEGLKMAGRSWAKRGE